MNLRLWGDEDGVTIFAGKFNVLIKDENKEYLPDYLKDKIANFKDSVGRHRRKSRK